MRIALEKMGPAGPVFVLDGMIDRIVWTKWTNFLNWEFESRLIASTWPRISPCRASRICPSSKNPPLPTSR
ncbi:hypothetical protein XFF6992_510033 [Xanthomonas citri pv. fuscans]|nr:hypothetical protein XFF6992_510033 [Xanthomonas citri pv. fuscans]SOO35116.1 hypothetical protein XFF6994_5040010 [Xanthomonas citri pv. fuscans]